MSAIVEVPESGVVAIDPEECVECGTCFRMGICPTGAIVPRDLEWPHTLRADLSDPYVPDRSPILTGCERDETADRSSLLSRPSNIGSLGRSHEMKTNDVTGRYLPGRAGIIVEVGRPVLGARLREVQKVTKALTSLGIFPSEVWEINALVADKSTGRLRDDVLDEKVNRCLVEVDVPLERVSPVLQKLREVAGSVDTVFAIDLISPVDRDGSVPTLAAAKEAGMEPSMNGKTNVGLGRPLVRFF